MNCGLHAPTRKGAYALRKLQEDPLLHSDGQWKVSDEKLVPILKERFGIEAGRRTNSKWRGRRG